MKKPQKIYSHYNEESALLKAAFAVLDSHKTKGAIKCLSKPFRRLLIIPCGYNSDWLSVFLGRDIMANAKTMKRRLQFTMRQGMFVFWALASLLWVIFSGYMFHFGRVVDTYRAYSHYENMIMRGGASDYNRRAYRRAAQDMDELNRDVMLFLLVGFGMPGLVLSLGTWLIRKK